VLGDWLEAERAARRVAETALTLVKQGSPAARSPARSKANLVSGSTSDLDRLPPDSLLSSPLRDTDANLNRATARISPSGPPVQPPPRVGEVSSSAPAAHPTAPPVIVSPPRDAFLSVRQSGVEHHGVALNPSDEAASPIQIPAASRQRIARVATRARRANSWRVLGALALSALVLLALAALALVQSQ
jgi:hypothetical protein